MHNPRNQHDDQVTHSDKMDHGALANNTSVIRMFTIWKRSVFKMVFKEVTTFLAVFITLSAVYRNVLNAEQKREFEASKYFFRNYTDGLAVPFLLGFYVTTIADRWWQQYLCVPWPDRLLLTVNMYVIGNSEQAKLVRQVLIRRVILMMTLIVRSVSPVVRNRYPNFDSLVKAGIMSVAEKEQYESINAAANPFWIPSVWFTSALRKAVQEGVLSSPQGVKCLMKEFLDFRTNCGLLWSYNWVNIPIIYTQVCTLSTYSYFIACMMARQNTEPNDWTANSIDIYFPIWTTVEMVCYISLLKVAEQIKAPFTDNDESFDLDYLISRHLKAVKIGLETSSPGYSKSENLLPSLSFSHHSSISTRYAKDQ